MSYLCAFLWSLNGVVAHVVMWKKSFPEDNAWIDPHTYTYGALLGPLGWPVNYLFHKEVISWRKQPN